MCGASIEVPPLVKETLPDPARFLLYARISSSIHGEYMVKLMIL